MAVRPDIKIISIDDFPTMRRIIKSLLKQIGFMNVLEADDGAMGLTLIKHEHPDLIISDWNMPKMNGLELLKAVRTEAGISNTPFIMITAEAEKENIVQAVQCGVSNFIVKPFTAEVLRQKINKVFGE